MKKITLTISSRDYTITLDDDFAKFFEDDWQNLMGGRQFIEPKELLNAFIEKCYENYQYSIDRNIKFEKRARCKNNCCPICNTKYKANKYFEIVGKLQNINNKCLLFSLTLNLA